MALALTVTTPHGFVATDAYHRVEEVTIRDKTVLAFHLRSYVSPGLPYFAERLVDDAPYDMGGSNPIEQAYVHLKSQPEFDKAIDC